MWIDYSCLPTVETQDSASSDETTGQEEKEEGKKEGNHERKPYTRSSRRSNHVSDPYASAGKPEEQTEEFLAMVGSMTVCHSSLTIPQYQNITTAILRCDTMLIIPPIIDDVSHISEMTKRGWVQFESVVAMFGSSDIYISMVAYNHNLFQKVKYMEGKRITQEEYPYQAQAEENEWGLHGAIKTAKEGWQMKRW